MSMSSRCLLATFGLLITYGTAVANDVPVFMTDTLIFQHHTDNQNGEGNDDNFSLILNRLNLSATSIPRDAGLSLIHI